MKRKGPPGFIKLPLENGMRRRDPKTKKLFFVEKDKLKIKKT